MAELDTLTCLCGATLTDIPGRCSPCGRFWRTRADLEAELRAANPVPGPDPPPGPTRGRPLSIRPRHAH
jgi:hypothetical protein